MTVPGWLHARTCYTPGWATTRSFRNQSPPQAAVVSRETKKNANNHAASYHIDQAEPGFSTLLSARQCKCHENPSNNYVRFRLNQIFPSACFQGKNALFYNISDCDLLAVPIYSLFHGALALVLSTWSINLLLIIVLYLFY